MRDTTEAFVCVQNQHAEYIRIDVEKDDCLLDRLIYYVS